MTGLTHAQISAIWASTAETPLSVKKIANNLGLIEKKQYLQVYNFFRTQKAQQHFFIEKTGGILWVRANPQNSPGRLLDLITDKQNSKQSKHRRRRLHTIPGLKRAGPERLEAILKITRCRGYGYTDKKTGKFIKTNNIREENMKLFWKYIDRTFREKITYTRSVDGDPVFSSENVYLPYVTRFTSLKRRLELIDGYRETWINASKLHLQGTFLTLTADPKKYESLWHCNFAMRRVWDRFRSLLHFWFHKKISWVCVREFQQNGRLHFHVIIFGQNWLGTKKRLQFFWTKYGGGYVMDIHSIRQTPDGWIWSRGYPKGATGIRPQNYLAIYLEKSMSPLSDMDYWLAGVRYWTASRDIRATREKKEKSGNWFLKGVKSNTGFRPFRRSDSNAFFSGALLNTVQPAVIHNNPLPPLRFQRASELYYSIK